MHGYCRGCTIILFSFASFIYSVSANTTQTIIALTTLTMNGEKNDSPKMQNNHFFCRLTRITCSTSDDGVTFYKRNNSWRSLLSFCFLIFPSKSLFHAQTYLLPIALKEQNQRNYIFLVCDG